MRLDEATDDEAGHGTRHTAEDLLVSLVEIVDLVNHGRASTLIHPRTSLVGRVDDECLDGLVERAPVSIRDQFVVGTTGGENRHGISCHEIAAQFERGSLLPWTEIKQKVY